LAHGPEIEVLRARQGSCKVTRGVACGVRHAFRVTSDPSLYYPGTMGCRQHCASPPRAESLTCRSSSHLLLWFESNGSHRHMRVTLLFFDLAESRLRRFQQNPAQCLRFAAAYAARAEKRGFRPRGKPSPFVHLASLSAWAHVGPCAAPSTSYACAPHDALLGSAFRITVAGAPHYTPGDTRDCHAGGEPSPFVDLTSSLARGRIGPYTPPSASQLSRSTRACESATISDVTRNAIECTAPPLRAARLHRVTTPTAHD